MKEDRRIQKTKKAITEALFTLLEKKDFNQLTINEIAEEANVNRGTVYFHYEDKYDLLNQCMENEYSCAMKSLFRKIGNQVSGTGNHQLFSASLLAHAFV